MVLHGPPFGANFAAATEVLYICRIWPLVAAVIGRGFAEIVIERLAPLHRLSCVLPVQEVVGGVEEAL